MERLLLSLLVAFVLSYFPNDSWAGSLVTLKCVGKTTMPSGMVFTSSETFVIDLTASTSNGFPANVSESYIRYQNGDTGYNWRYQINRVELDYSAVSLNGEAFKGGPCSIVENEKPKF